MYHPCLCIPGKNSEHIRAVYDSFVNEVGYSFASQCSFVLQVNAGRKSIHEQSPEHTINVVLQRSIRSRLSALVDAIREPHRIKSMYLDWEPPDRGEFYTEKGVDFVRDMVYFSRYEVRNWNNLSTIGLWGYPDAQRNRYAVYDQDEHPLEMDFPRRIEDFVDAYFVSAYVRDTTIPESLVPLHERMRTSLDATRGIYSIGAEFNKPVYSFLNTVNFRTRDTITPEQFEWAAWVQVLVRQPWVLYLGAGTNTSKNESIKAMGLCRKLPRMYEEYTQVRLRS